MPSLFGWIGNVFIVTGLWKIGNKTRNAFIFSIIGESCWIANSYIRGDWALLSICCVFNVMAIRSFIRWGKDV